jgi:hypothetical protein
VGGGNIGRKYILRGKGGRGRAGCAEGLELGENEGCG